MAVRVDLDRGTQDERVPARVRPVLGPRLLVPRAQGARERGAGRGGAGARGECERTNPKQAKFGQALAN